MQRFTKWLDQAPWLSRFLKWLSDTLAMQRGLPVIVAIGLTLLSLLVHILWVVTGNIFLGLCGFGILHLAILIGLIGVLLAEPLGRG